MSASRLRAHALRPGPVAPDAWAPGSAARLVSRVSRVPPDLTVPAQLQPAPDGEWIVSGGARLDWQSINTSSLALGVLRFGDFGGDGRNDAFRKGSSGWFVSWGGMSAWTPLNNSSLLADALAFGDLDGDGRADVFYGNGTTWSIGDGEYVFAYGAQGGRRRGETCSGAVFTFSCSTVLTWVVHPFRRSHVLA